VPEKNYDDIDIESGSILEANSKCELKDFNSRISVSLDRGDKIQVHHPDSSDDSMVRASKDGCDKNLRFDVTNVQRLVAMGELTFGIP
jgi:hypothetical protein